MPWLAELIAAMYHWIRPIPRDVFYFCLGTAGHHHFCGTNVSIGRLYVVGIVPYMTGMLIHQLVGSAERAARLAHRFEHADASGDVE
jgi:hypothetical protein